MADTNNSGSSNAPSNEELINQLKNSPFGPVFEIPNADQDEILAAFGKAFGDGGGKNPFPTGSSPDNLPYDGNPFAGENFWNIFAGGVDPTKGGDPLTGGGGSPFPTGGSGSPFPTGGSGSPFPTGGSGNPPTGGGSPFPTDGGSIPFPTGGSGSPSTGGGSPFPTDGGSIPFPTGGNGSPFPIGGSGSPFPTGGSGNPFA
ncbi:hypothetical protein WKK05_05870 [Nostoc sp. UHCC 0302]|uniref:hypothetical protein n=1 Tax=Nostoc sp. UHCC 0302 TaxID=3134896 RepID=UPI00311CB843